MAKAVKKEKPETFTEPIETGFEVDKMMQKFDVPENDEPSKVEYVAAKDSPIYDHPQLQPQPELTMEDKIVKFLEGKNDFVKMNDFLKSLYPIPTMQNPAKWMQQQVSKTLKGLLDSMVKDGVIKISGDKHLQLGKPYYHGADQRQAHHNLTSIEIYGKIA